VGGFGNLVGLADAAPELAADKQESFVVGPYSLGDWYKSYRKEEKDPLVADGPDDAEIMKSFKDTKFYLIDCRVLKDKDNARFPDEGYPKLVVGGS
jgi:hypothetical protein